MASDSDEGEGKYMSTVLGGDKIARRRNRSNRPVLWRIEWRGPGLAGPPRLPRPGNLSQRTGLQPPHLSDGLTVGPGRNPDVDAGRLAGREAGRLDMALW